MLGAAEALWEPTGAGISAISSAETRRESIGKGEKAIRALCVDVIRYSFASGLTSLIFTLYNRYGKELKIISSFRGVAAFQASSFDTRFSPVYRRQQVVKFGLSRDSGALLK